MTTITQADRDLFKSVHQVSDGQAEAIIDVLRDTMEQIEARA